MFVHLDGASNHTAITLEVTLPVGITQHNVGSAVGAVLIGAVKEAPKIGLNTQYIEVVSARLVEPDGRRTAARVQAGRIDVVCDQPVKAPVPVTQIAIVGIRLHRGTVLIPTALSAFNHVELLRLGQIERPQNERIHHPKDHRVGPDAKGQRRHGYRGKVG